MKKEEKKFYANKLLEKYIEETKNSWVKKAMSKGFSKEQAEFLWDEMDSLETLIGRMHFV